MDNTKRNLAIFIEEGIDKSFMKTWNITQSSIDQKANDMFALMEDPASLFDDYENCVDDENMPEYVLDRIIQRFVCTITNEECLVNVVEHLQFYRESALLAFMRDGGTYEWIPLNYKANLLELRHKLKAD